MTLPEEILINLAANLAAELITRAGGRLRDLTFGDAETRALGRAWQRAFQAMLEAVAKDLHESHVKLLDDILHDFVAAEGVAGALLDLALAGDDPPLPELRARFDALDFDRATLAVDFDAALAALTRGLDAALLDEAEQPGSPLYNRVSLRRLTAVHRLLRRDAPPYRPGAPFQAPAVPRYFVPRPEVSAALMAYLTADAPRGALVVSAVHGLGGIGKTTLVAALAREPAVEARFPDGVLWATLGQTPDALSLLAGWIQALGDYDFRPTVAESASGHLRTLLRDKACLLVVDDAWDAGHARPFLVGGPRCWLLVTTRDAALARKVGAQLYDLDVMSEAQALALFEARLGPLDGDRETAAALARELGYLPLALELAAAQVEAGCAWAELLALFRRELADLAALDLDKAEYRNESLRLSFRLSLERLAAGEQAAFAWLGVLPEDARLNPAMAATLWECEEAEARKRLRRLRDRALLKPVGEEHYTLHDLLHHEAGLRLEEQMPLPQAHTRLLARYKRRYNIAYDQWHRLPDDGYIHERLIWHMERAGQPEAVHALLRLETEEERNAWYEAREALGQTAGYLEDIRRAWRLATLTPPPGPLPSPGRERGGGGGDSRRGWGEVIGLQCRYALIVASLNSLATNLPPSLIAALVKEKVWTPAQGLAYARQTPNSKQRAEALTGLAPHLPESLKDEALREALAAAREIENEWQQASALAGLAPHLPEPLLREALVTTQKLKEEWVRAHTLAGLVPHLPQPLLQEALVTTKGLEEEWMRADTLAGLASRLQGVERTEALREALAAVREIEDERDRARSLAWLAPRLAELGYPEESLAAARAIEDEWQRIEALAGLVLHLPTPMLCEAMATAREIENEWWRTEMLAGLAPHLAEPLKSEALREALAAARAAGWELVRARALARLAPHLPQPLKDQVLHEALVAARGIKDKHWRAEVLAGLAPHLPELLLREALATAREIEREDCRAWALTELALHLSEAERVEALHEALATARAIQRADNRAEVLTGLVPHLPAPLKDQVLQEALTAALAIENELQQVLALGELAPYLPAPPLREALAAAREIGDADERTEVLVRLVPHLPDLPESLLRQALAAAQEIEDKQRRASALAGLAPRLAELGYPEEALAAAQEIEDERQRATALAGLAPHLPEPLEGRVLQEALTTAQEIFWASERAEALTGLARRLAELGRLKEALVAARVIEDADDRDSALAGLAPRLVELGYPEEALAVAREIRQKSDRAETLAGLAPYLPEAECAEALCEALAEAREIFWRASERVEALAGLVPHLPEPLRSQVLHEALATAREMEDEGDRATVLTGLVPHLPEAERAEALYEALAAAREIEDERQRASALAGLAPHLMETLLREALAAVREIEDEGNQATALVGLVPRMAELGYPAEALTTAREIEDEWQRVLALAGLSPHLPAPLMGHVLHEAMAMAWATFGGEEQTKLLAELVPRLAELPTETLFPLWHETLPILAARTRKDLLADLGTLAPVIHALGGQAAIEETFRAVQDVGRWWP